VTRSKERAKDRWGILLLVLSLPISKCQLHFLQGLDFWTDPAKRSKLGLINPVARIRSCSCIAGAPLTVLGACTSASKHKSCEVESQSGAPMPNPSRPLVIQGGPVHTHAYAQTWIKRAGHQPLLLPAGSAAGGDMNINQHC
jgi:hypothetical protein